MPRLTKRIVESLKPNEHTDLFIWDSEIRGLGVRLKPSGTRTFFVQYRNHARRTRRLVLGQHGVLTVEQARELARERLVEVIKGEDPSAERKAMKNACTVQDLCKWYLREAESGRLLSRRRRPMKASSVDMDRSCINTHILPLLGTQLVAGLGRADIERLQADITAGKTAKMRIGRGGHTTGGQGAAFRTVTMLHSIFEHGIRMGLIEANPAKCIRKAVPQPRDRRLSEKEIIHLGKTITLSEAEGESPTGLATIKLILLTGFRRNEALSLETSWLDGGLRCVRFPDTKTGRQTRAIGRAAAQLIKSQCLHSKSLFVFPADSGEGHFIGAPRVMQRLIRKAGLSKISLHTLRHTFASIGGELGFSELTLAGLLGHASRGVTQRYIHLDEALVVAADRISERIAHLLETGRREARNHKSNSENPKRVHNVCSQAM